jgi:Helix-turn-helix.
MILQKIRPDMDIGRNIQRLRKQNSLTQNQVIARLNLMGLNMSPSTYAKIETNRMNIRISELVALSIILNVEFNNFFEGLK